MRCVRRGIDIETLHVDVPPDMPLFEGATPILDHVDPDLTLWGLRLIYARNRNP